MTEITVDNVDWRIISDLASALQDAQIGGERVFNQVTMTASEARARHVQLAGSAPKAMIRYVQTDERETVEDCRSCTVTVELVIAARVAGDRTEGDRLAEILRLVNAARNAVETSPPADACYWGDAGGWRNRLRWGRPVIDATDHAPWALHVL